MGAIVACSSSIVIAVLAEEKTVPSWIKNTAKFWVEGQVSDIEFLNAIQWLIDNNILIIPGLTEFNEFKKLASKIDVEEPPLLGIAGPGGAFCISHISGDPYDEGQAEFLLDIMNHDSIPHSPIIELQLTDEFDRPIVTKTIEVGKLEPKETKTIREFMDFTRIASYCNVVVINVN